jgi:hypothetical protein
MKKRVFRKSRFSLDDSPAWEGYADGETWNGFSCPCFETKTAIEIAKYVVNLYRNSPEVRGNWNYDPHADTLKIVTEPYESETFGGNDITVDDKTVHVYAIGAYNWCWYEVSAPMHCLDCNDVIAPGANYIEGAPLHAGGVCGVFCCSDCAGNFFVRKMCISKVNE